MRPVVGQPTELRSGRSGEIEVLTGSQLTPIWGGKPGMLHYENTLATRYQLELALYDAEIAARESRT